MQGPSYLFGWMTIYLLVSGCLGALIACLVMRKTLVEKKEFTRVQDKLEIADQANRNYADQVAELRTVANYDSDSGAALQEVSSLRTQVQELTSERDRLAEARLPQHPGDEQIESLKQQIETLTQERDQLHQHKIATEEELQNLRLVQSTPPPVPGDDAQRTEFEEAKATWEKERAMLKSELERAQSAPMGDDAGELGRLRTSLATLTERYDQLDQERDRLQFEAAATAPLKTELTNLRSELSTVQQKLSTTEAELAGSRDSSTAVAVNQGEMEVMRSEIETLQRQLESKSSEPDASEALRYEIAKLQFENESLRKEVGLMLSTPQPSEEDSSEWKSKADQLQQEVERMSDELELAKFRETAMNSQKKLLAEYEAKLQEPTAPAEDSGKLAELEAEVKGFDKVKSALEAKVDQAQSMALESATIIANLETSLAEAEKSAETAMTSSVSTEQVEAERKQWEVTRGDLESQVHQFKSQADKVPNLESERQTLADQLLELQAQQISAQALAKQNADLEAELKATQARASEFELDASLAADLKMKLGLAEGEKTQFEGQLSQLQAELNSLQSQQHALKSLADERETLRSELETLRTKEIDFEKAQITNGELSSRVGALERAMTELNSEKTRLQGRLDELNRWESAPVVEQKVEVAKPEVPEAPNMASLEQVANLVSEPVAEFKSEPSEANFLDEELEEASQPEPPVAAMTAESSDDDLEEIIGVGPIAAKVMRDMGLDTFKKIAHMTTNDIDRLAKIIDNFKRRISSEKWVDQASILHRMKYGERI